MNSMDGKTDVKFKLSAIISLYSIIVRMYLNYDHSISNLIVIMSKIKIFIIIEPDKLVTIMIDRTG